MSKALIDYSNTIIYKICCKDHLITDIYIGQTTNFVERKHRHKYACNNINNKLKLYNTIRDNGGWENWDMVELAKYNCKNSTESRIKEQEYYEVLKPTLNSCPPFVDKTKYFCIVCNLQCKTLNNYDTHINTKLHIKKRDNIKTHAEKITPKSFSKFCCDICNYNTCKKSSYDSHFKSARHKKQKLYITNYTQPVPFKKYTCEICNKKYQSRNGIWKHKSKCFDKNKEPNEKEIIVMLMNQNLVLIEQNASLVKML